MADLYVPSRVQVLLLDTGHHTRVMAVREVVAELNRVRAKGLVAAYAIGGAVAAQAYIEPSATEDIDVFVVLAGPEADTLSPLTKLSADLIEHGAAWDGPYLLIHGWPVQLLLPANPLYEQAIATARSLNFGNDVVGQVMGPEYLAAIALQTGRTKDYARLDEFLTQGQVDRPRLMQLIAEHGLIESWNAFRKRFPEGQQP